MVIGFDAKYMLDDKGGLGHYGRLSLEALTEHCQRNDYILYTPDTHDGTTGINKLLVHASIHLKTPHSASFGDKWRTGKGILKDAHRHGVQVFHGLSGMLPEGIEDSGMATVVTIGSLLHKRYSGDFSFFEKMRINRQLKATLKRADAVVAMSEFSKREIMEHYGVADEKIRVIMPVCESHFSKELSEQVMEVHRANYVLPEKYILASGNFDERHNLTKVVEALAKIDDKDVCMVIVGHRNSYYEKLKQLASHLGVSGRIMRIKKVHESDLPAVYKMASVVVCPSRYECASLSIPRAFKAEVPVVAATGSCMEEYGGDAALYFSPDSADELADALNRALGAEREALLEAEKVQAEKFASARLANQLNELYRELKDNLK